jgi:hypothetical protein
MTPHRWLFGTLILAAFAPLPALGQTAPAAPHVVMEGFPDAVRARIEGHERQLASAASSVHVVPFHIIVPTLNRWTPGSTVRVAFLGGDPALYAKIEDAASEWTKPGFANLHFQFKGADGKYNQWSPSDTDYKAEIRVAFASGDAGGYWSNVGTDSTIQSVSGPGQVSLNLDSFDQQLPPDWRAITMHEFGHAIGFQHEHQNPAGGCDFRFEDDPGYVPTTDGTGWYANDDHNRRPGLYTYLGGKANYWPKSKVDFNLRAIPVSSAFLVGSFDKTSIMKYFFGAFMFVAGDQSPCFTPSENLVISDQDKAGAHEAYSDSPAAVASAITQKKQVFNEILASPNASSSLKASINTRLKTLQ